MRGAKNASSNGTLCFTDFVRVTIRMGQISNIRGIIESGKDEGMITMDNSLMARVKDGTVEPKEAYMKGSNKALFAPLLKPGDLDGGH